MAHYAKYTRGAVGHLTKHYERAKDEHGEYVKFGNENIDPTRTELNYNLAPHQNQLDKLHERLGEVYCMKRKDVNVMCSCVVTCPDSVPEEHEREFFERAYKFLEEKHGMENVISAYVHKDETSPHLHFTFVPVVYDKKKDRYKVSAKEVVTRAELRQFHKDLQAEMDRWIEQKGYDFECNVLNGATENGNLTIQGLKAKELEERNEIEMDFLKDVVDRNNEECAKLNELTEQKESLQTEVETLSTERDRLKEDIEGFKAYKSTLEDEIKPLEEAVDSLKGDRLTLMERFINNPKIKPIFDNFCKSIREQINAYRQEQREKFSGMSMSEWKAGINQARANAPGTEHRTSAKHKDEWER